MPGQDETWTARDASAHFGDVIDAALNGRPQRITQLGKAAVVVVAEDEWRRVAKPKPEMSLGAYLATYPLSDEDVDLTESRRRPGRPNPFSDLLDRNSQVFRVDSLISKTARAETGRRKGRL
jgi:antitoxin Phd